MIMLFSSVISVVSKGVFSLMCLFIFPPYYSVTIVTVFPSNDLIVTVLFS